MKAPSRSCQSRARSVLSWAVGWFVLAQLLGGLALDYVWPWVRFPSAGQVMASLERQPRRPDIVCLGSSRLAAGIHAATLSRTLHQALPDVPPPVVLNAAVPAGDLITADYLLQQLLHRGVRPRLAVIEVNPETLNHYNEWFFFHVRRQLCWEDVPTYFRDVCRAHQAQRLLAARLLPLYIHRRQIQYFLFRLPGQAQGNPLALETQVPRSNQEIAQRPIADTNRSVLAAAQREATQVGVGQAYRWLKKYRVGGASAAALERLLARCAAHHIQPILVAVPVTQAHRAAYTASIEAAFQDHMRRVCQRHGCRFVDCRAQLPDTLFVDNHHLLPTTGGGYFSRKLALEVLAPVWRTTR